MEDFNYLKKKCRELGKSLTSDEWNQVKKVDYPNLRTLKKEILLEEARVAQSIADFPMKSNRQNSLPISQFEYDMKWFLTWRVKWARFPHVVWCDGVEVTEYEKINERLYRIKAQIWLGPESNVNIEFKCEMEGMIKLNSQLDKLQSYQFQITYQGQECFICK